MKFTVCSIRPGSWCRSTDDAHHTNSDDVAVDVIVGSRFLTNFTYKSCCRAAQESASGRDRGIERASRTRFLYFTLTVSSFWRRELKMSTP